MVETRPSTDRDPDLTLIIEPAWTDPITGAVYVHRDLDLHRADWVTETHVSPPKGTHAFGDVPSWAEFVKRYAAPTEDAETNEWAPLLTWNASGLSAVLDFHSTTGDPGRCQWVACCPFVHSPEWLAWVKLASGGAIKQRELVEQLEDLAEDIREPSAADLMALLRSLRANVQSSASAELRPDGTTAVAWSQDKTLTGGKAGELGLPGILTIAVPVLKGDPQPYQLQVRLRVNIDDSAHLAFRLSLVNAERVLEAVYQERVIAAERALGDGYSLLRGSD